MTNNKQQTAVEWFNDKILIHLNFDQRLYLKDIFKQAKEMEKDRMIQFAKQCLDKALDLDVRTAYSQVEQYYNETHGGHQ